MENTEISETATGRITIDDVRAAISNAGLTANSTNSGAIRAILGRGSMGTIQKHLVALRTEAEPKLVEAAGDVPAIPKELNDAIWRTAWSAAQANTSQALAKALLERDKARESLATAEADLQAMTTDADDAMSAAAEAAKALAAAQAIAKASDEALAAKNAEANAAAADAEKKLSEAFKNAESITSSLNASHALQIAHKDTEIETLKGVIGRLSDQLAEVKSLLPRHVNNF